MGLGNRSKANFVRIKDGKFYLSSDLNTPYDELSGYIKDISFRDDEFEGKTIRKLVLNIDSDGDSFVLAFPFDSSYSSSFVSFIKNADLSKEVVLVPVSKTEGDKTTRSLLVKQDGNWLKSYYTKATPHGQPDFKKVVKKSGKVEWDKEDFLEFRENVIMKELKPSLRAKIEVSDVDDDGPELTSGEDEDNDELPF